ncbi:MAG TPA: hypothetical protein VFF76_04830 [Holophagaceae bacterium]|jgi:hypothetical protein|nr:hypothetical protein [Holophagaceae bacterium]
MSPVRALLISHFQAGWNRAIREMGRNGTVALVIVACCAGFFALLPITAGLGFTGWVLGRGIHEPWAPAALGAIFTATAVGGGLLGGILGGAKTLDWERLRAFPLRRGQIFGAELVAGLGDLLTLMIALGLVSLSLGLILAQPFRTLFTLALLLASLVVLLTVQLLVGGLATALLRHLKTALFVLLGIVWISSVAMGSLGPKHQPRESRKADAQVEVLDEARLRALGERIRLAAEILPATQSAHGLGDAGLLGASLRQLPLLALAGLLAWAAAGLLWRESVQDGRTLTISAGQAKLWSFSRPAYGLARLQWRTLMGSMIGRFAFLIPIVAVVLIKGPMGRASGTSLWAVPGAFIYLAFGAAQLLFNMFGLDQGAVKGLLLLPIAPKELLYGKSLGFGIFMGLQGALLALLLALFGGPGLAPQLPAGLLLFVACTLAMGAVGLWSSVAMPRPLSRKRLNNSGMPLPMILLSMGTSIGCAALFGGLFALLAWAAPRWLVPSMAAAAGLMLLVFRAGLEIGAVNLVRHRERLVERLG